MENEPSADQHTLVIERIAPLVGERGFEAVTVEAMARAACVSKATFYRIFPSKEAVRQALLAAGVAHERLETRAGREALLDAAMEVFAASGYASATVDAIAQAAGMSKAGFYWHFAGKEAIFAAVIARYAPFEAVGRLVHEGEEAGAEPREILTGVLTEVVRALTPRFPLFRTIMLEAFQNPAVGELFRHHVLGVVLPIVGGYLTRQMAAGRLRPMHPAIALQALIGPLFLHLLTRDLFAPITDLPPIEAVVDQIVTTFLDGARPRADEGGAA
jgi:AcrR family transcriptional regulator